MEPVEITELEQLKQLCLTKAGKPKKGADKTCLERMNQLQEKLDAEGLEVPDGATVTVRGQTTESVLNVCGKRVLVNGPAIPRK